MSYAANIVEQARAVRIEDEIVKRGIKLKGKIDQCGPCPRCGGTDRFSINVKKQLFNCRGCGVGGDVIQLVQHLDRCGFPEAIQILTSDPGRPSPPRSPSPHRSARQDDDVWRAIWCETLDPHATPVETYLARRGLPLPERASECLRFHPNCVFGKNEQREWIRTAAMIALVRNIISNEPQAIHRTALNFCGCKVEINGKDRMVLGSVKGGAVKLTSDEDVTTAIAIGEGIETTLSLQCLPEWQGSPAWSLISADGVENFPVLCGIETLIIAVDHDQRGEEAALAVSERWRAAGCEALLVETTKPDNDLNDVVLSP
jgi:hypothetical protein